ALSKTPGKPPQGSNTGNPQARQLLLFLIEYLRLVLFT
ncbi:MAG: hypothetical protein ACI95C_002980, partial [Pseudohongiellaceae bacterium]